MQIKKTFAFFLLTTLLQLHSSHCTAGSRKTAYRCYYYNIAVALVINMTQVCAIMWLICSKLELRSQRKPLLCNSSKTFVSRKRLGEHVPAATDMRMVFSTRSAPTSYQEDNWGNQVSSVR
jgi:hypothetical protein